MTPLPDKPSELIRIALDDLEACEADPRYEIDMGRWHGAADPTCSVCLAGAVMAQRLRISLDTDASPSSFDPDTDCKLLALNEFRMGYIGSGLDFMKVPYNFDDISYGGYVIDYRISPITFKKQLRDISNLLESKGL